MTTIQKIDAKERKLQVNVWPKSKRIPAGQLEIFTTRGQSVVMTLEEWDEFNERITSARSLTPRESQIQERGEGVKPYVPLKLRTDI